MKLLRYAQEVAFALSNGAGVRSKLQLAFDTLKFHLLAKRPEEESPFTRYGVRLNGRPYPIFMRLRAGDIFIFYEVLLDDVYSTKALRLPENPNIIDLGANIGLSMLRFASQHPQARILCVEPDIENFRGLLSNARVFGKRVQCVRAAISSTSGTVRLSETGMAFDRKISNEGVEVPAITMAEVISISGFDRIDLLKVDIEGAEAALFSGDVTWLNHVDAIMIELHGDPDKNQFAALVERFGLQYRKGTPTPTAIRVKKPDSSSYRAS